MIFTNNSNESVVIDYFAVKEIDGVEIEEFAYRKLSEIFTSADYNSIVRSGNTGQYLVSDNGELSWIQPEEEKPCKFCGSVYHDAKYHHGTCVNCGGPRGEG